MLRWPFRVALLSGLSAVFPFATVWFERWAGRGGYLAVQAGEAAPTPAQETSGGLVPPGAADSVRRGNIAAPI